MRTKQGVITSAKMQDTVTVTVHRYVMHPQLKKRFRVSTKFLADTNGKKLHEGDEVVITECSPLSKRKHFKVTDVVKQAVQVSDVRDEELGTTDKGRPQSVKHHPEDEKNNDSAATPSA